jgi:hypothetical protein
MRTKVTLVLLFLNVALFFVIFQFERSWRTESVAREVRKRVLGAEAADIRSLDVESAVPGGSFSLERRADEWFLTKPISWRANPNAVSRIVSDLEFLEHDASFSVPAVVKNGQSLADYGLAPPRLTVTFTSGGRDTTGGTPVTTRLRIGEATKVGRRLYLLSPDGARIHVVGRELADDLSVPLEQLRAETVLTIPVYEARALNVQTTPPSGVRVIVQRDGARWSFYTPIAARASKDAIELAISNLGSLRVKSFLAPNAPVPPALQLQVEIVGNTRYETLFIGAQAPGQAGPDAHPYYAQLEDSSKPMDRSPWFIVDIPDREPKSPDEAKSLLVSLRDAQESLRDRHVLDVDPSLVTMIALKAPNQPDLTLQRLDPDTARAAPASEARWQILIPGDGSQGPTTLPADRGAVQRLLDRFVLLSAEQFVSDAPQESDLDNWGFNRPQLTIAITQQPSAQPASPAAPPASPLTLEIGRSTKRDDPYAYAMLANARSVYAVDPQILKDTPVAPREWRDRLVASLPGPARVTGLEIDDLRENKPVVRWDASSGAAPAAVRVVLDGMRQMRAARFVGDGFADKVTVAGEERPWRYRLQATVALPGAGASEQTGTRTILIAERSGGAEQIAGSEEFGTVFVLEQPMIDALWTLIYGSRDPGLPPAKNG